MASCSASHAPARRVPLIGARDLRRSRFRAAAPGRRSARRRRQPRRSEARCAAPPPAATPARANSHAASSSSSSGSVEETSVAPGSRRRRRSSPRGPLARTPPMRRSVRRAGRRRRAPADRRILAERLDELGQRLSIAPDHRRVVEWIGDRRRRRQHAPAAAARSRARARAARARSARASSAPCAESPPEQVMIAIAAPWSPALRQAGALETAIVLASSSRSWTSSAQTPPASSTRLRKTR